MHDSFSTISSKDVIINPYWTYALDNYVMPSGRIGEYHYVKSRGSVFVIARDANGNYLMTKQYRYLNRKYSIEFPGGGMLPGINPDDNARKELAEELELAANQLIFIGEFNPCNGMTDEICSVYLAEDLHPIESEKDESELIEPVTMTEKEINQAIRTNNIWDGMTLAAWALYNNYKNIER